MASFPNPEPGSAPDRVPPVSLSRTGPVNKRPTLPSSFFKFPVRARLKIIQQYINSFEYKQSPQTSYNSHKLRPLARIMDTAKMMVYNPQPIKCVEAVFLALYLTAGIADAERIPLGFSSEFHGQVHQHIVLIVRYINKYGAFGISRQKNLMSKEFDFESLSSIVDDFKKAYEQLDHKVTRIRVGLPVEHNIDSFNFVCWRYLSLDPSSTPWQQCLASLEKHMSHARRLWVRWLVDGQGETKRAISSLRNCDSNASVELQVNKSSKLMGCSGNLNAVFIQANATRQLTESSLSASVKALKRQQEPDKEQPHIKLAKRAQALQEIPWVGNILNQSASSMIATRSTRKSRGPSLLPSNKCSKEALTLSKQCSRCQNSWSGQLSARRVPRAHKNQTKKKALKCYSLELLAAPIDIKVASSRKDHQIANAGLHQDRQARRRAKQSIRKCESRLPVDSSVSRKCSIKEIKRDPD